MSLYCAPGSDKGFAQKEVKTRVFQNLPALNPFTADVRAWLLFGNGWADKG
jgi:hypothetical protein